MTSADATASIHAAPVPEPGVCSGWPKESGFIREVLDRIGDKWTVLVIGTLRDGPLRYSALHAMVPGISQRMLTLTLQQLARDGLVTRVAFAEVPPRVEYSLTPLGTSLLDVVLDLSTWAVTHYEAVADHRRAADLADGERTTPGPGRDGARPRRVRG